MAEDKWTVTYFYYGTKRTAEFDSLTTAVGFACDGEETWQYAAKEITGPGGMVLSGDALHAAKLRFMLPERYGDLDDMPLPPREEFRDG